MWHLQSKGVHDAIPWPCVPRRAGWSRLGQPGVARRWLRGTDGLDPQGMTEGGSCPRAVRGQRAGWCRWAQAGGWSNWGEARRGKTQRSPLFCRREGFMVEWREQVGRRPASGLPGPGQWQVIKNPQIPSRSHLLNLEAFPEGTTWVCLGMCLILVRSRSPGSSHWAECPKT